MCVIQSQTKNSTAPLEVGILPHGTTNHEIFDFHYIFVRISEVIYVKIERQSFQCLPLTSACYGSATLSTTRYFLSLRRSHREGLNLEYLLLTVFDVNFRSESVAYFAKILLVTIATVYLR